MNLENEWGDCLGRQGRADYVTIKTFNWGKERKRREQKGGEREKKEREKRVRERESKRV